MVAAGRGLEREGRRKLADGCGHFQLTHKITHVGASVEYEGEKE